MIGLLERDPLQKIVWFVLGVVIAFTLVGVAAVVVDAREQPQQPQPEQRSAPELPEDFCDRALPTGPLTEFGVKGEPELSTGPLDGCVLALDDTRVLVWATAESDLGGGGSQVLAARARLAEECAAMMRPENTNVVPGQNGLDRCWTSRRKHPYGEGARRVGAWVLQVKVIALPNKSGDPAALVRNYLRSAEAAL